MMTNLLSILVKGTQFADQYISEDLEAICDDTLREYAEGILAQVRKAVDAGEKLTDLILKEELYLDAVTDMALNAGQNHILFKSSKERNDTLRSWAHEFADRYAGTDWNAVDYVATVNTFAQSKSDEYLNAHPVESDDKPFKASFVFGTEATRAYQNAVDDCVKWDEDELERLGGVGHYSFDTQQELDAFMQGVEAASGYLEASYIMNEVEWAAYLAECEQIRKDEEEEDNG